MDDLKMNNKSEAEESDTDSKDIINRGVPPSNVVAQTIPGPPIARLNLKNKFEYLIQKTRVIVGRSGGDIKQPIQEVDVSIDSCSLYISRRHFDIFTNDCVKFFVSVYSKNGLFVNGSFVRRGSAAHPLKSPSRLRFPKTDTKIIFSIFEHDPEENTDKNEILGANIVENEVNNISNNSLNTSISEKISSNVQNFNNLSQQPQLQQINISSSSFHNMNDDVKVQMMSPQSKLEREVYKHQQRPTTQQQLQMVANRKRRFPDIIEMGNQDWMSRGDYSDGRKPPFSYSQLIAQAIFSTPEHMLCLNDIYLYITKTYPFYRPEDKGWQNSIRHNLSLSKSFVRMPRANDEGKGSLWTIQPNDKQGMVKTAYRPRGTRDKYNALNHSNHTANLFVTPNKNPGLGDSEESNEIYQNEDEEAANNISLPQNDSFNYLPQEQYGEGDADHTNKGGQSTILQSSFASPMQIFMQPRKALVPQTRPITQLHINNLNSVPRNSGSLQVVRLSQLSSNDNTTQASWQQPQQHQIFIPQQQQIKVQQPSTNSNNQRIIIVRSTNSQQPQQTDGGLPASKKIKLASSATVVPTDAIKTPSLDGKQHNQQEKLASEKPQAAEESATVMDSSIDDKHTDQNDNKTYNNDGVKDGPTPNLSVVTHSNHVNEGEKAQ